jgi:hypothetical protein
MRRFTVIAVVVALAGAGIVIVAARPDLLARIGIGTDSAKLRQLTRSFLEDVQFKDFDRAASYHAPDEQKTVDIPYLLERLFLIKPEQLDIMEYEILFARIDSTGLRGRVKSRVKIKDLVRKKIQNRELMLYYHRASPQAPWYMKLETSLRKLDVDQDKKH